MVMNLEAQIEEPMRADRYICRELDMPRSKLKNEIKQLLVNDKPVKLSFMVQPEDKIQLEITPDDSRALKAEKLAITPVYKDKDILVINKPAGLVVHPAQGHWQGTLVNHLLTLISSPEEFSTPERPGIVHRLDRDTSGLMVCALNPESETELKRQFKEREVVKSYEAVVQGDIYQTEGSIDLPIDRHPVNRKKRAVVEGGRDALTHWRVLDRLKNHTRVELDLVTGRTHQIRVHMEASGHPVLGDHLYSRNPGHDQLHLFSSSLQFRHPVNGDDLSFQVEPPDFFSGTLKDLSLK